MSAEPTVPEPSTPEPPPLDLDELRSHYGFLSSAEADIICRLADALADARVVLMFADGLAVSNTGYCLAELYAADFRPAQDALRAASCHPRGRFHPSLESKEKP